MTTKADDVVNDIDGRRWDTAVICGAGIAGLLAAWVAAEFFERVVIVERDKVLPARSPRPGVPQGHHIHLLLPGGRQALEELIPGFTDALVAAGGIPACNTNTARAHVGGCWLPRFESDMWSVISSRGLFEAVLRQRVLEARDIEVLGGRRATDLISARPGWVTGVAVQQEDRTVEPVVAELVIDALGRSSLAPSWLAALGYDRPEETVINGFWGYASRYYDLPTDWDPGWLTLAVIPTGRDGHTRGAVVQRQDGGRWMCTLIGCARDFPPTGNEDFHRFAASLPVSDVADALECGEPLGDAVAWRRTENRLRRFEACSRRPEGFVVVGDGAAMLNPVYGHGMSVASFGAAALRRELTGTRGQPDLAGFAHRLQTRIARVVALPWNLASGADYSVPGATTEPLAEDQRDFLERWSQAMKLAEHDPSVARLMAETRYLLRGTEWLYADGVADPAIRVPS